MQRTKSSAFPQLEDGKGSVDTSRIPGSGRKLNGSPLGHGGPQSAAVVLAGWGLPEGPLRP